QPDEKTGQPRAIASCSRRFSDTEHNYSATEREAVAVLYCCEQFHHFILGEPGLTVYTDHKPLVEILQKMGSPTHRLRQLAMKIDMYQPTAKWVKGSENGPADAVSRSPMQPAPRDGDELAFAIQELTRTAIEITPETQQE